MRTARQLLFAGETAQSLVAALDAHDARKAVAGRSERGARRWIDARNDMINDLATICGIRSAESQREGS